MNLWHRILDLLMEAEILRGQHKSHLLYPNHFFTPRTDEMLNDNYNEKISEAHISKFIFNTEDFLNSFKFKHPWVNFLSKNCRFG